MSVLHTAVLCCLVTSTSLLSTPLPTDVPQDTANTLLGERQDACCKDQLYAKLSWDDQ